MDDYDVVVIGAGNAGLTAALSLARKGCKTLLLERHNIPGGCATSFIRGRFEFEVALHQLSGLGTEKEPGPLRSLFGKLGILEKVEFVEMENLYRIVLPGQLDLTLKANREEIIRTLKERFPREAAGIDSFFDLVYRFSSQLIFGVYGRNPDLSRNKYPDYFEYALSDLQSVLDAHISDPLLKMAICSYWSYVGLPPSRLPFLDYAMYLFTFIEQKPFHFKGGSQSLSSALLDSYLEAGGHVRFQCAAKKILVTKGKVQGVVTQDGSEIRTHQVISNCSTLVTYLEMIDRAAVPAEMLQSFSSRTIGPSIFSLYMGFDREPKDMGVTEATNFICLTDDFERQYRSGRSLAKPVWALYSNYDAIAPDFSSPGTSQAALLTTQYVDNWLSVSPHEYSETKCAFAGHLLNLLDQIYPDCRGHIEEMEIATPLTYMRYLGHPGGAIYGFDQYVKDSKLFVSPESHIEGLIFAGSWAGSGGFQPTLIAGEAASRTILKSLNRRKES